MSRSLSSDGSGRRLSALSFVPCHRAAFKGPGNASNHFSFVERNRQQNRTASPMNSRAKNWVTR